MDSRGFSGSREIGRGGLSAVPARRCDPESSGRYGTCRVRCWRFRRVAPPGSGRECREGGRRRSEAARGQGHPTIDEEDRVELERGLEAFRCSAGCALRQAQGERTSGAASGTQILPGPGSVRARSCPPDTILASRGLAKARTHREAMTEGPPSRTAGGAARLTALRGAPPPPPPSAAVPLPVPGRTEGGRRTGDVAVRR